jgi:hypothetical protein
MSMLRFVLVLGYLAGTLLAIALLNADFENSLLAMSVLAVASVALGWGTERFSFALLAFLAVPLAVPFGFPDHYAYSEPFPIWVSALYGAFISATVILLAALLRYIAEYHRRQREGRQARGSSTG